MEIRRFLEMLYRRLPVIFVVAALAMVVVTVAGIVNPPVYTAQASVRVLWDVGLYDLSPRDFVAERLVTSYVEAAKSHPMLEAAIRRVSGGSLPLSPAQLADSVWIARNPDSELLTIYVQDISPSRARDLANELALQLIAYAQTANVGYETSADQIMAEQAASLESELQEDYRALATAEAEDSESALSLGLGRQIREKEDVYRRVLDRASLVEAYEAIRANSVKVVAPATLPQEPSNKLGRQEIALALVIGLIGGIGLALLLEGLDTRIRTPEQAERLARLPALGIVPRGMLAAEDMKPGAQHRASQQLEEPYRLLGASLLAALKDTPDRSIIFTDTNPREDGSEVVSSVAPIVAQSGPSILLIDANLRQPTLHQHFGIRNLVGLCSILEGQAALYEAVQDTATQGVSVLTSGPVPANPSVLLSSPNMVTLLETAEKQYDLVLLNTTPALAEPSAAALARLVDRIILVLPLVSSTEGQLNTVLHQLRAAGGDPLGLVLLRKGKRSRRVS